MRKLISATIALVFLSLFAEAQQLVRYDLYVRDTLVNYAGKKKRAIAVNGQIPMPTLHFTEGDTAEIHVHNELKESTSLHWHGLLLPNKEDGVPYLTQLPIKPHSTHVYKFPIVQHGTHWYHSHTKLQEQIGMYGSFIIHKRADAPHFRPGIDDLPTIPVILSEWTNLRPRSVHRMLHNASDWFSIKKGSTQSYSEAIVNGHFKTKVKNEWKRMLAMDVSDVYYDRVLINGSFSSHVGLFKAGDTVRLQISNGGASTYFWLSYAGGPLTVVANDGNDVEPVTVDRLIIAVSETYDVLVTIPKDSTAFEFLATSEDRTRSASIFLSEGMVQAAHPLPKLKYFEGMQMMNGMMKLNGNLDDGGMKMTLNQMDMNNVMYAELDDTLTIRTLNYAMLRSPTPTNLPDTAPTREFRLELSGNMNRYVWSMDNKVVSESDRLLIKKGEKVRMILYNGSMMRHPMHLHGHDFRLLNGQGAYAPLKNVADIMPMETDTLEFYAHTEGDWFFHCHILYHMMSGMGRIFRYSEQAPNTLIPNPKKAQRKLYSDDRKWHSMATIGLESNGSDGEAMLAQTRWKVATMWHLGMHEQHGYESETMIGRYVGKMQWLYPYVGFDYHYKRENPPYNILGNEDRNWFNQKSDKNNRRTLTLGIAYTLPMLVVADVRADANGKFRAQLSREGMAIAPRLRFNWMINSDKEFMTGLRYIVSRTIGLSTHYDSDMGWGAGITIVH